MWQNNLQSHQLRIVSKNKNGIKYQLCLASATRRNARERNRVKNVTNGYAALRDHILGCEFEFQRNPPRSTKTLCQLEIIRLTINHIRSLEEVLDNKSTLNSRSERSSSLTSTKPPESARTSPSSSPRRNIYTVQTSPMDDSTTIYAAEMFMEPIVWWDLC